MFKELLFGEKGLKENLHWRRARFDANLPIVREGERSENVYFVLQGTVQVTGRVVLGGRVVRPGYQLLEAGEIFGELALIDRAPHCANVIAVDDVELAVIPITILEQHLAAHPHQAAEFFRHLALVLSRRLRRTDARMLSLLGWGLQSRGYGEL